MTSACKHTWIRYVLDDSPPSHAQKDGLDEHERPYRDVPMLPRQAFWYADTIGSTFGARVIEAICRDCKRDVLDEFRKGFA